MRRALLDDLVVGIRRMGMRTVVEREQLQRPLLGLAARAFEAGHKCGNGQDDVAFGQLPLLGELGEFGGIYLDLARFGRKGVLLGIPDERIDARIDFDFALVHAHGDALVVRGQPVNLFAQLVVELAAPVFARHAAFGVLVVHAQALGQVAAHFVDLATLVHRLADRLAEPDAQAVVHLACSRKRVRLLRRQVGQDDVGKLGRRRHEHVVAQDELAQRFIAQDIRGEVDVAVLACRHVVSVVHQHLDARLERIGTLDAGVFGRERGAILDGLGP